MPTRCNRGFIADLIACSTCFGHHYAHHQELKSIIQWLLPVVFHAESYVLYVNDDARSKSHQIYVPHYYIVVKCLLKI